MLTVEMKTVMWQLKPSWRHKEFSLKWIFLLKQAANTFHFLCHLQLLVWGQHRRKAGQTWQRGVVRGWWMCVTWILMSHFGCQHNFSFLSPPSFHPSDFHPHPQFSPPTVSMCAFKNSDKSRSINTEMFCTPLFTQLSIPGLQLTFIYAVQ